MKCLQLLSCLQLISNTPWSWHSSIIQLLLKALQFFDALRKEAALGIVGFDQAAIIVRDRLWQGLWNNDLIKGKADQMIIILIILIIMIMIIETDSGRGCGIIT